MHNNHKTVCKGRQEIRQSRPYRKVQQYCSKVRVKTAEHSAKTSIRPPMKCHYCTEKQQKQQPKHLLKAALTAKKAGGSHSRLRLKPQRKATVATAKAIIAGTNALVCCHSRWRLDSGSDILIVVLFVLQ